MSLIFTAASLSALQHVDQGLSKACRRRRHLDACAFHGCDLVFRTTLATGDDGTGISAGNAPRIFGRFFTTARDSGGTGLGLSIVRSHLDAIGVSIVLLPSSRGALFRIEVPAST
jgi:signal transduction histidine kinase